MVKISTDIDHRHACSSETHVDGSARTLDTAIVPQWEWCLIVSFQLGSQDLADLPATDWGVYSELQNTDIERAWQEGLPTIEVIVGIRTYQIIFDGGKFCRRGGMVQYDPVNYKLRNVRRRLVSREERDAALSRHKSVPGDSCAICCERFAANLAIPVVRLQCSHCLHGACAQALADGRRNCPLCRSPVSWDEILGLSSSQRPGTGVGGRATHLDQSWDPSSHSSRLQADQAGGRRVSWADQAATPPMPRSMETQGIHPGNDLGLWLLLRAQQGKVDEVRAYLRDGVDIDFRSPAGATPLISAATFGHHCVVNLLLNSRADVHLATHRGNTALNVATLQGHAAVAELLLAHGAA